MSTGTRGMRRTRRLQRHRSTHKILPMVAARQRLCRVRHHTRFDSGYDEPDGLDLAVTSMPPACQLSVQGQLPPVSPVVVSMSTLESEVPSAPTDGPHPSGSVETELDRASTSKSGLGEAAITNGYDLALGSSQSFTLTPRTPLTFMLCQEARYSMSRMYSLPFAESTGGNRITTRDCR